MNIFALDESPVLSAKYHCDKHVVKMILETAQMLSTVWARSATPEMAKALYESGVIYAPTHQQHPCVVWAGLTRSNYAWLSALGLALCAEYTARYGKVHKCERMLVSLSTPPSTVVPGPLTDKPQCMPEDARRDKTVEAYRQYYRQYKKEFARWQYSAQPPWW